MESAKEITSHYELLKIILDFLGVIIWPITTLSIILIYKKAILNLINRTKKVELPGGVSFEAVENDITQAKELAQEIKTERKSQTQKIIDEGVGISDSQVNRRMVQLGLRPSPSGLNLDYYKNIANTNPNLALAGLRLDFELMLRNLAKGFSVELSDKEPIYKVISKLFEEGAITSRQNEFIRIVFKISNAAVHGASITKEQVYEVLNIGKVLVDDYIAWLKWGFEGR